MLFEASSKLKCERQIHQVVGILKSGNFAAENLQTASNSSKQTHKHL